MGGAVLVITGPTACGKSDLALQLADRVAVEVISADSAQVYKGMDIGTAKPGDDVQQKVPHHLISILDPADAYSAARFRSDVEHLVGDIAGRGKLPLIVGGTMLYLKALRDGLAEMPEADAAIRQDIVRLAARAGWPAVHDELGRVDPDSAARIRPTDTQRLQRALEVYRITGSTMTELHRRMLAPCPFPLVEIAVMPPSRSELHQTIEKRFHAMLARGFIEEVRALFDRGDLHPQLPSIKAVGYRQIWSFLAGEVDYETMIDMAVAATRQLAKRQYTWLRSFEDLHVIEKPDIDQVLKIARANTILG